MWFKLILILLVAMAFMGCAGGAKEKRIKIGFAMDTLKEERWQRDKDAFEAHCKQMNVDCVVTVADNKADKQANDVDNLLTQGVDALVIALFLEEIAEPALADYIPLMP